MPVVTFFTAAADARTTSTGYALIDKHDIKYIIYDNSKLLGIAFLNLSHQNVVL